MTIEEITRPLETIPENQAHTTQSKVELEATVQEIAQFHQQVLKDHSARQAKLDEAIRVVVELLRTQEERIDGHDGTHSETDARLKVLIGSQTLLSEKIDKLTSDIVAIGRRFDQMAVRLYQVTENVDRLTSSIAAANVRIDWFGDRLDRIGEYVDGWGNGKERCTIRHVLIHTGGFPMYGSADFDTDLTSDEVLGRIAATPAAWEPGTRAGYHAVTGWKVLGAVVEAVDGRPIETYLRDEVLAPIGANESSLGVSRERQVELGDRLVPVAWKGHRFPVVEDDGGLRMLPYRIDQLHNEPWHVAKPEPGASMRGPARDLGHFYESLLGLGPPLLEPHTVELMGAVHRHDLRDAVFGFAAPWGLGVTVDLSGGAGRRAFGHGGRKATAQG